MRVAVVLILSLISIASSTPWLRISSTKEVVVLPKTLAFNSAVETCDNMGGELLSMATEHFKTLPNKILDLLITTEPNEIWLGRVKKDKRAGVFTFEDGSPLPMSNLTTLRFEGTRTCLCYRLRKVSELDDFKEESCSSSKTVICQRHPDSANMTIAIWALALSSAHILVTTTCLLIWFRRRSISSSKFRLNSGKEAKNSNESSLEAKEVIIKVDLE